MHLTGQESMSMYWSKIISNFLFQCRSFSNDFYRKKEKYSSLNFKEFKFFTVILDRKSVILRQTTKLSQDEYFLKRTIFLFNWVLPWVQPETLHSSSSFCLICRLNCSCLGWLLLFFLNEENPMCLSKPKKSWNNGSSEGTTHWVIHAVICVFTGAQNWIWNAHFTVNAFK